MHVAQEIFPKHNINGIIVTGYLTALGAAALYNIIPIMLFRYNVLGASHRGAGSLTVFGVSDFPRGSCNFCAYIHMLAYANPTNFHGTTTVQRPW